MASGVRLDGRVAVVAGGAGAIGSAAAEALARSGATVVLADKSSAVQEVATRISDATGGRATGMRADLTRRDEVDAVFADIAANFGPIEALVHAAGVYVRRGILEMTEKEWDETQAANLRSFFLCTQAAVRVMLPGHRGRIISITSGMGVAGRARSSAYAASKAALVAFTKSVAAELVTDGITINCIGPGITESPLMRGATTEEEIRQSVIRSGRPVGDPRNVAGPVLYFMSDAAKSVTGTTLWLRPPG